MDNNLFKIDNGPHADHLTVPDGFFADFNKRMAASLPDRPALQKPAAAPRTLWQRVRPYAYMAAMFAGVWCMLKVFTLFTNHNNELSIDSHPALATAVANEEFVEDYIIDDISEYDIYYSMSEEDMNTEALEDSLFAQSPELTATETPAQGQMPGVVMPK